MFNVIIIIIINILPGWSAWSGWSFCSVTCGAGNAQRRRTCSGGRCPGNREETRSCFNEPCDIGTIQTFTKTLYKSYLLQCN